jgi:hypothetical protein
VSNKFFCILSKSAAKTLATLNTVYGHDTAALKKSAVYKQYNQPKNSQESPEYKACGGRPSTDYININITYISNDAKV